MNPLLGAMLLLYHAATGTVVTIYPDGASPAPVTAEQIKESICPTLLKEARHVVEPVTYRLQWMKHEGDRHVPDEAHLTIGPVPDCRGAAVQQPKRHEHRL